MGGQKGTEFGDRHWEDMGTLMGNIETALITDFDDLSLKGRDGNEGRDRDLVILSFKI